MSESMHPGFSAALMAMHAPDRVFSGPVTATFALAVAIVLAVALRQVARRADHHLHVGEPGLNQQLPGFRTRRQQIVPNRPARPAVDGVHPFPAQIVQDEQMATGSQDARQVEQGNRFVGKVRETVVADDEVEPSPGGCRRGKRQAVHVRLNQ